MANWQMVSQGVKYHSFAKYVARRACQYTLEITSSQTIWKGYLFHVIIVATLFLQDPVWESTKVNTVRQLELIITNKKENKTASCSEKYKQTAEKTVQCRVNWLTLWHSDDLPHK